MIFNLIQNGFLTVLIFLLSSLAGCVVRYEEQLYEDLLYGYNKIARPVKNSTQILTVKFGASLIRLIDVDEKNQVVTTNLWLELQWKDTKMEWEPKDYNGIKKLHIPSDLIWTPDIVLYNNAAGDPDITIYTDALVYSDGTVVWKPPAIYKSFCPIDVTWFPYDSQECKMKFGTWTFTGSYVDIRQLPEEEVVIREDPDNRSKTVEFLDVGMDLSYYSRSAEWDLLSLSSARHEIIYSTCCGPEKYVDVTYYFSLRRKTLFYTVNLIIPCFLISVLTTFVFYLSDHKITLAISMLVTLIFFFLVLIDIIPPTSLVIPMFGRYLMTTMILVTLSIMISVVTVNFHFRKGSTHRMPIWIRKVFLDFLPNKYEKFRILRMNRPVPAVPLLNDDESASSYVRQTRPSLACIVTTSSGIQKVQPPPPILYSSLHHSPFLIRKDETEDEKEQRLHKQIVTRILQHIRFIADHFRVLEEEQEISDDWTYVGMVIDRLFFFIFGLLNLFSLVIILQAPVLYDTREPLSIPKATRPLGLGQDNLATM